LVVSPSHNSVPSKITSSQTFYNNKSLGCLSLVSTSTSLMSTFTSLMELLPDPNLCIFSHHHQGHSGRTPPPYTPPPILSPMRSGTGLFCGLRRLSSGPLSASLPTPKLLAMRQQSSIPEEPPALLCPVSTAVSAMNRFCAPRFSINTIG